MSLVKRQKYLFICSLIGRNYNGVQRQIPIEDADLISEAEDRQMNLKLSNYTVQEALERILSRFTKLPTKIHLSSRLDKGVNAYCLPFHVTIQRSEDEEMFDPEVLKRAVNGHLRAAGEEISILDVKKVRGDFNSRFFALRKEYIYRVESNAGKWMDYIQQQKKGCWSIKEEVDLEKVKEGMKIFIGRHDFTQFTSVKRISSKDKSTIKKIDNITLSNYESEFPSDGIQKFELKYTAKSFLVYQIRFMTSALVNLGLGTVSIEQLQDLLANPHNYPLGALNNYKVMKAPGEGLYLANVSYDDSVFE